MPDVDLRDSWNRLSAHYQRIHRLNTETAHYGVFAPDEGQLRLLGDVAGKRLLEIGCGGGQCSLAFAKAGAECVGVDLSDEQIAHARALAEQEGVAVAFHREDMAAFLEAQPDASFDIVFSAYALQYVEDLTRIFRQARRVLRPGGRFVFSLDHPLSNIAEWDGERVRLSGSYFDRGRMDWEWDYPDEGVLVPFRSYHRTVGDFLNLLADAGFYIERLLEPEPTAENDAWAVPGEFEKYSRIPATIIWKARRPAEGEEGVNG